MRVNQCAPAVGAVGIESRWNVMAHGDAREGKWSGNWRMYWVASTLHKTSEHGVSSITNADAHTSAARSRLNWWPRRFKWTRPFRLKTEIWFLRVCHHISNAVYQYWPEQLISLRDGHFIQCFPTKLCTRLFYAVTTDLRRDITTFT